MRGVARPRKFDESTRRALIDDAAKQILAGGLDSVSLRPLAAKHGCPTTAIYTMFGSRDALITAVRDEAIDSYLRAQGEGLTGDGPIATLLSLGRANRRWALTYPQLYHVIFGRIGESPLTDPPAGRGGVSRSEFVATAKRPMCDTIRTAIDQGLFREVPVDHIGASLWAGVHGWVTIELRRPVIPGEGAQLSFDRHVLSLVRAWCVDPLQAS
ncbi:hypothetical protein CIB50_0000796 [Kocuria varians]|uniref:HTH tetR-type domain-containing protein n=1 Tax=Kocuria varians TaxID=1272 RepID=A0A7D7PYC0_KOCVA|nr:hypothetical protein CIB50_0000796 [Kocuria varians]